ncbi:MAG: addiction module protein [Planctomycetota bacterium]|nr:addiction module protein [Planctomycetota bacterium]
MSMNEQQLIEEVLKLPEDAQHRVIQAIEKRGDEEMDPEIKAKWAKILEERRKAYEEGRSKTYTKEEFMKRLRERVDAKIRESSRP